MEKKEINQFQIENIYKYITDNKNLLVNMNLSLDSHEISKSLTGSLNRSLMGTKTTLSEIYDSISNNFDEMNNKIKIIENQLKQFNNEQQLGYFIDPDNIFVIVFFKQFTYIQNIISEIYHAINSNVNFVFIYLYLISKIYDEPDKITSNYVFIIQKIINSNNFTNHFNNGDRLKDFLNENNINKIYFMTKTIYSFDKDFSKLIDDLKKEKRDEYTKNNITDYSDSYKDIENKFKNIKGGHDNSDIFYNIEQKYTKKKEYLLLQKRNIDVSSLFNSDYLELIFKDGISIELWYGYNLFIYKRFIFDFNDYQSKINEIIKQKQLDDFYLLNLDYLNDLDVPDAGILLPSIIGGGKNNQINNQDFINNDYYLYKNKYLKYKNKYINLKNKYLSKKL